MEKINVLFLGLCVIGVFVGHLLITVRNIIDIINVLSSSINKLGDSAENSLKLHTDTQNKIKLIMKILNDIK